MVSLLSSFFPIGSYSFLFFFLGLMEGNGMAGGMLPSMAPGMLGLDMPLHHPHQQQQHHPHQMVSFATEHHPQSQQQQAKHPFSLYSNPKGKQQQITALSDEDEQACGTDDGGGGGGSAADSQSGAGKRGVASPWQRMKWTDSMVKLLIMVVYFIGDDGGGSAAEVDPSGKKKVSSACGGAGGGGSLLQKKGKWKSVSRAMMEKGFYVSPQQCEDKFNDLNKRYKRVNDILGKGTACKVVENQSLLDNMDNLSPKMKEEVRKLLNSKHLFFREMCAYHNSCNGGNANVNANANVNVNAISPAIGLDSSSQQHQHQHQKCIHSSGGIIGGKRKEEEEEERDVEEEEEDDDSDDDDDDDDDEEEVEDGAHGQEEDKGGMSFKRPRPWSLSSPSPAMQQLSSELVGVMQDGTKSAWEQRQWLRRRSAQLEEQRVGYQYQAFQLEKQRFKWLKFSVKKEREMEKLKLDNERMRLENERMVLLLRHKELELDLHAKRPDNPSVITG